MGNNNTPGKQSPARRQENQVIQQKDLLELRESLKQELTADLEKVMADCINGVNRSLAISEKNEGDLRGMAKDFKKFYTYTTDRHMSFGYAIQLISTIIGEIYTDIFQGDWKNLRSEETKSKYETLLNTLMDTVFPDEQNSKNVQGASDSANEAPESQGRRTENGSQN